MNALTLAPRNMPEAIQFAEHLAKSQLVPTNFRGKPNDVLVAIQWGYEVGLSPLQALQNISVINGRPSIWGDAAMALVRAHPACEWIKEGIDGEGDARRGICVAKRRGEEPQSRSFSVTDAKRAKLWNKDGTWQTYPDRMLQMRARGFAIRDVFPDALRGVITREEAQDMPQDAPPSPPIPAARGPTIEQNGEKNGEKKSDTRAALPPNSRLPLLSPDGEIVAIPFDRWGEAVRRAVAKMESHGALRTWEREMQPIVDSIMESGCHGAQDIFNGEVENRFLQLGEVETTESEEA